MNSDRLSVIWKVSFQLVLRLLANIIQAKIKRAFVFSLSSFISNNYSACLTEDTCEAPPALALVSVPFPATILSWKDWEKSERSSDKCIVLIKYQNDLAFLEEALNSNFDGRWHTTTVVDRFYVTLPTSGAQFIKYLYFVNQVPGCSLSLSLSLSLFACECVCPRLWNCTATSVANESQAIYTFYGHMRAGTKLL